MITRPAGRPGLALALLALIVGAGTAHAEPYLAVANGYKCTQCHVNPTGGGERTPFGEVFAQTAMPAQHIDTGDTWTGQLNKYLAIGGDLRYDFQAQQVPHQKTTNDFEFEQARVYLSASVIPDRLIVYVDEHVAPGGALNEEAWGQYWSKDHSWYVKAGQMYLPFGFRLQDQSAFVKAATGINMTTPDHAVEFGWLKGNWDVQLAVGNGTASGPTTSNGKQESLQVQFVRSRWRVGAAANFNDSSADGSRDMFGIFAGLKTGPIAWLAEADYINDHSLPSGPGGGQKELATLLEANYSPARGHNIKVTWEYLDPDRELANDQQTRWSIVYELTPIQFLQLRAGVRLNDGIPQLPAEHLKLYFVQLHGFF